MSDYVEGLDVGQNNFRRELLEAISRRRDIGVFAKFRLKIATRRPDVLNELREFALQKMVEENVVSEQDMNIMRVDVENIDWSKFLDFLIKIAPLIITLIGLF